MDAFLPAAGMGTRLLPLTQDRPKALVEAGGRPMIDYVLQRLQDAGVRRIVVNVHHFAEQLIRYLARQTLQAEIWISDERDFLCDTGGGIRKALRGDRLYPLSAWDAAAGRFRAVPLPVSMPLRQAPFIVYNVDIWCDTDLNRLYEEHLRRHALATLAVKERPTSRALLVDDAGQLCGWRDCRTGAEKLARTRDGRLVAGPGGLRCSPMPTADADGLHETAFSGIHVISPEIGTLLNEETQPAFSITDVYLKLCSSYTVCTQPDPTCHWMDMGKTEALPEVERFLRQVQQSQPNLA